MNTKLFFQGIDYLFATFLGITILDLLNFIRVDLVDWMQAVDISVQYIYIIIGLVYFILKGIHNFKMNILERREKEIENLKKLEELEGMEIDNEKKSKL